MKCQSRLFDYQEVQGGHFEHLLKWPHLFILLCFCFFFSFLSLNKDCHLLSCYVLIILIHLIELYLPLTFSRMAFC
jgi:hypothetical protein